MENLLFDQKKGKVLFAVAEIHGSVHEDLQPDLHDVPDLSLVRLSPVPGAHAAGKLATVCQVVVALFYMTP